MRTQVTRIVQFILAFALASTSVFALGPEDVARSMGLMWNYLGAMFSFEYVQNNPVIQQGILKFLFFILLLAVIQFAAKKVFQDNKLAGIIAFCIAAITVWFTPNVFLGHAIVALAVPFTIVGGLTYIAMRKLTDEALLHFFGLCIMLFNIALVNTIRNMFTTWDFGAAQQLIDSTFEIGAFVVFLLTFYKGLAFLFALFGAGNIGTGISNVANWLRGRRPSTGATPTPQPPGPATPTGVGGWLHPIHTTGTLRPPTDELRLWWRENAPADNVSRYDIYIQEGMSIPFTGRSARPIFRRGRLIEQPTSASTQASPLVHALTGWSGEATIYVRIVAVNGDGQSSTRWLPIVQETNAPTPMTAELDALLHATTELVRLRDALRHFVSSLPDPLHSALPGYIPYARTLRRSYQRRIRTVLAAEHAIVTHAQFGANNAETNQFNRLTIDRITLEAEILLELRILAERGL